MSQLLNQYHKRFTQEMVPNKNAIEVRREVSHAKAVLVDLFERHEHVFLAFSGGKESIALARLCEPYRGRFSLVWVNTGFTFPHVEAMIRSYGERFGLCELKSDLVGHWKAHGLPANILPVDSMLPDGCRDGPKLQTWASCCLALRTDPLRQFALSYPNPIVIIHGQRFEDRAPGHGLSGLQLPGRVETSAPLSNWTTEDVMAFVEDEELELPSHYSEIRDSLDCWVCPAAFDEKKGAQRVRYMKDAYPNFLRTVLPGVKRIRNACHIATGELDRTIREAESKPSASLRIVVQRNPSASDCTIAALATVIGRNYEDTASLLGFPCNWETGDAVEVAGRGIHLAEIIPPLLSAGMTASVVLSSASPDAKASPVPLKLPSTRELKGILQGRRAVLLVEVEHAGRRENHALAWVEGRAIDCRGPEARDLSLDDLEILAAAIIG